MTRGSASLALVSFDNCIFAFKLSVMSTEAHYDMWSSQYDTNENKTRDLEAVAIRNLLDGRQFRSVLEIGCGTGKNTVWLAERAERLLGVDLSGEMLAKAKDKLAFATHVQFLQADITRPWTFAQERFDLVTFSLVLEHIADLDFIFAEVGGVLAADGRVYVGEFHPFRQYLGKGAKYETADGVQVPDCFVHHTSDFVRAAERAGLSLVKLAEYFDDEMRSGVPRILGMVFEKK
jgi:predicted TPR repeat methyltransferase